jgi:spore germination protein YaaH
MPVPPVSRRASARLAIALVATALVAVVSLAVGVPAATLATAPLQARTSRSRDWWGFTAPWDARSAASVRGHADQLAVVVSGWVALDTLTLAPRSLYPDSAPRTATRFALVTDYYRDRFRPEAVRRLAADTLLRAATTDSLAAWAAHGGYRGLVLDFEGMTPADTTALRTVVAAITRAAHRRRVPTVAVTVIAGDTLAYPTRALLSVADRVIVMVYDQHWATGTPGPIASPDWAQTIIEVRAGQTRAPSRLIVAVPVYGYEWRRDRTTVVIGAADATRLAATWGVPLARDSASLNLTTTGPDSTTLWVADARVADTLAAIARGLGVHTIALWRLGLEDSTLWRARGTRGGAPSTR